MQMIVYSVTVFVVIYSSSRVETVHESVCDGPEVCARGQEVKQMVFRVGWIFQVVVCSAVAQRAE